VIDVIVLVGEVPTWQADRMPFAGFQALGGTADGPADDVRRVPRSAWW